MTKPRIFGTDTTTRHYIDPAPVIETPDGTLRVYAIETETTNPGYAGLLGFPLTKRGYVSKHPRRIEVALDWLPAAIRDLIDPKEPDTADNTQHLNHTPRGFGIWADFSDRYGQPITITTSSLATDDCVWIHPNHGESIHLTVEQAQTVRDALDAWITSVAES